jgi:hypothetical protein
MINTKIEYVVQVLHNSLLGDDDDDAISVQLLLLSSLERKYCLSIDIFFPRYIEDSIQGNQLLFTSAVLYVDDVKFSFFD